MKQIKLTLVFLLFIGVTYAQEQATTQTDKLDITQIEEKAVADAKADFTTLSKLGWGVTSIILTVSVVGLVGPAERSGFVAGIPTSFILGILSPPAMIYFMPVYIPQHRELEISSMSSDYQTVYRFAHESTTKKQRVKSALAGPVVLGTFFVVGILLVAATVNAV